ncbi:TetR/AcrR family transcriptional regulator [Leuconostoc suionicum]|uniref:TetR/AcrR family transcriptional regulator n=1 Tax=Leuconostoc suionicum TaxID=1511761 RepID=UPI00374A84B5
MTDKRRRGDRLEKIIYKSTLKILERDGYAKTSFAEIARDSKTSRTVLYRRWDSVFELVHDALTSRDSIESLEHLKIDTGNLRDDLISLGNFFQDYGSQVNNEFIRASVQEFSNGSLLARRLMSRARRSNLATMKQIVDNAIQHGELEHVPSEQVQLLLFELLRYHDILVHDQFEPNVTAIIDEIVLPAFLTNNKKNSL